MKILFFLIAIIAVGIMSNMMLMPVFGEGWQSYNTTTGPSTNPVQPMRSFDFQYRILNGTGTFQIHDYTFTASIYSKTDGTFEIQIPRNYPYYNGYDGPSNVETYLLVENGGQLVSDQYVKNTSDCFFTYSIPFWMNSTIKILSTDELSLMTPIYGDSVPDSCNTKSIPHHSDSILTSAINQNSTKKINLWSYDPPDFPGPLGLSSNGSFAVIGTRQDDQHGSIYLLDNSGVVIWSHVLGGLVKSLNVSPNDKFIEARTGQILNNGGVDYGYNEWDANPALYVFDNTGQVIYHNEGLLPTWKTTSLSSDGSLVASSNGNGILYSDKSGKALWGYKKSHVTSVSVSPDGSFIAGCTANDIVSLDKNGILLWDRRITNAETCSSIVSTDLGYVLIGQALSDNVGKLYLFDKHGNLVWAHIDSYENVRPIVSADKKYEIETVGNSQRGYGDTVSFNKLDYGYAIPEFPFVMPDLLVAVASLVVFLRMSNRK